MTTRKLLFPERAHEALGRRFYRHRKDWLAGGGEWPVHVSLGGVTESDAVRYIDHVRNWIRAWQAYNGPGAVEWRQRRWRTLGTQQLPERLILASPGEVAESIGEAPRWRTAKERYAHMIGRWPALHPRLSRHFDILADYSAPDFDRLESLLSWLEKNPRSDCYPRQLPVAGMDSKWLGARKALVVDLICALRGLDPAGMDFYQCCGLRSPPSLIRMRICDPALRRLTGGLGDVSAPADDIARLALPARRVFIVENLQTGIAFTDLPGAVVFMGLGYNVDGLARLDWIHGADCFYWGDIDTHGFAILSRARSHFPRIRSLLMDEKTLLDHASLWVTEMQPHAADWLPHLTDAEQRVYQGLKQNRWGTAIRLEQERIFWPRIKGLLPPPLSAFP